MVNKFDVTGETISIHALREEGDAKRSPAKPMTKISIHALREEGDIIFFMLVSPFNNFYPRPPRGGRPAVAVSVTSIFLFLSTPSARRATSGPLNERSNRIYFYPRPPRGGRPVLFMELLVILHISIHALREEGDAFSAGASCFCAISIHALREEGDGLRL